MKPLHESKFDTESGSRAYTAVCAGLTPTGEPFRRVVVTADAEMDTTEARRLIADLQHAVALAEEQPADAEDQPKPREWHKGDEEPDDFPTVASPSGGNEYAHREGGWFHTSGCTCCVDIPWGELVRQCGVLTEVLPDSEQVRHG